MPVEFAATASNIRLVFLVKCSFVHPLIRFGRTTTILPNKCIN
jgi:hypothetical protein